MNSLTRVAVLGSTGSIGTQTLDVLEQLRETHVVTRLAGGKNIELLKEQQKRWNLNNQYARSAFDDKELLAEFASCDDVDIVINGVVGFAGFSATLAALNANKILGLANKESMIAGAPVVKSIMANPEFSGRIIPVDSEHSAIWQCLRAGKEQEVQEIVLTASGGPFRRYSLDDLKNVKVQDALKHPTWSMGPKISIDSATLMNKGLEVIEAHALFSISFDRIKVVVHPQSIVHSMVTFQDGATIAQLSYPDMRLPISLALGVEDRLKVNYGQIDFSSEISLTFEPPDRKVFKALDLAYEVGRLSQGAPAVFSGANEMAVEAFLKKKIDFLQICEIVEEVLQEGIPRVDNEYDVYEADRIARERAKIYIEKK